MLCPLLHRPSLTRSCRRDTPRRRLLEACRALAAPLAAILAFAQTFAEATPVLTAINYTGTGYAVGTGGPDSNWKVVALPVNTMVTTSTPYAAWVFSGTGVPPSVNNVPPPWYGGAANAGLPGYGRWIGARENDATAVLSDDYGNGKIDSLTYYTTIYSTTFESTDAGSAFLWFRATADNAVTFFVNGTVTGTTTNQAGITGGSQVAARIQGLNTLKTISGTVNVIQGTNTLYAVVEDLFNPTSQTFGYTGLIVVPEPSTLSSVGMAGAGLAVAAAGRRLRRRPQH